MRMLSCALALGCLLCASVARADSLYNLTLTSSTGTGGGSGTLDLDVAPAATGTSTYFPGNTPDNLLGLNFSVDGETFSLDNAVSGYGEADFTDGQLTYLNLLANGSSSDPFAVLFVSGLSYNVADLSQGFEDTGTITATAAATGTSVTPEPSSLLLLGTGLMAGVGVLRRRLT